MSGNIGGTRRFHLSDEARDYFERIGVERNRGNSKSGMFSAYVEPYYLCLLIGLVKNIRKEPTTMSKDMVSTWKSSAKQYEKEISGIIFYKFCLDKGISHGDDRILKLMEKFFAIERVKSTKKKHLQ